MHKNTLLELRTNKNKKKEEKWQLDGEEEEVKGIRKKMKMESKEGEEEKKEEKLWQQKPKWPLAQVATSTKHFGCSKRGNQRERKFLSHFSLLRHHHHWCYCEYYYSPSFIPLPPPLHIIIGVEFPTRLPLPSFLCSQPQFSHELGPKREKISKWIIITNSPSSSFPSSYSYYCTYC